MFGKNDRNNAYSLTHNVEIVWILIYTDNRIQNIF